jgi:tRNA-5-methyluridine54 2-sulfurtransferase
MDIEKTFLKTLKEIKINKKDKILVALSGGKDSALTLYLLNKFGYNVQGLYIDLKLGEYSKTCLERIQELCEDTKTKLYVYDISKEMGSSMAFLRGKIQNTSGGKGLQNCAICGVIKKWILNKKARELKVDYIATGHNLDDEAQTFLINIFKGNPKLSFKTGPVTKGNLNSKFIPRIKPVYYIPEEEIKKYTLKLKLPVSYLPCPCGIVSYRIEVRNFLEKLPSKIKKNILKNFEIFNKTFSVKEKNEINFCKECGEPSRNEYCRYCQLLKMVK